MRYFPWVTCTDVRSGNMTLFQIHFKQFIHVSHDQHVRVEHNNTLNEQFNNASYSLKPRSNVADLIFCESEAPGIVSER